MPTSVSPYVPPVAHQAALAAASVTAPSFDAVLFDLDGVITPTVDLHRKAWAETFDAFFAAHALPPYSEAEYFASLDGRSRLNGIRALLAARGIELPDGDEVPGVPAGPDTVVGIGTRKNDAFTDVLERDGIVPYPGSLALLDALASQKIPLGIVSSSRNAESVLRAACVRDRFAIVVDGTVADAAGLPGKPAPDTFVHAAGLLGVPPARTIVVEDAGSGTRAGRDGGFGLVVGVDRGAGHAALLAAGAHLVVDDLEELIP